MNAATISRKEAIQLLVAADESNGKEFPSVDEHWAAIDEAQRWAALQGQTSAEAAQLTVGFAIAGNDYLQSRGRIADRERWLRNGIDASTRFGLAATSELTNTLALLQSDRGNSEEAIALANKSIALADDLNDAGREASAYDTLGLVHLAMGQVDKAAEALSCAEDLAANANDARLQMKILQHVSFVFRFRAEREREIEKLGKAIAIARELRDERSFGNLLGDYARALAANGELTDALAIGEQALSIAENLHDTKSEAMHLALLGEIRASLQDNIAAIDLLEKSRALMLQLDQPTHVATTMVNVAHVYAQIGQFDQSLTYSQEALEIRRGLKDGRGISNALSAVGSVQQSLGNLADAKALFIRALDAARASGATFEEGRALLNLGAASGALGDPEAASNYTREALVIFRAAHDKQVQITALLNLARSSSEAGELGEPERILDEAIPLLELFNDPRLERARMWRDMLREDRIRHSSHDGSVGRP